MRIPFFEAQPIPLKYVSGTDITRAQGQETTRKLSARIIQSLKSPPMIRGGINASTAADITTIGV